MRPVDPQKKGFAFAYWYYVDSSTNTEIRVISGMCIDRNLQLFAKFIEDLQLQSAADDVISGDEIRNEVNLEVKAGDLTKIDGAIPSDDLLKDPGNVKDDEKPTPVTVTITGATRTIVYDGQRHNVTNDFSISCSDPACNTAALKASIIEWLDTVAEKDPINAGEYATGPKELKDDQCNNDPNYYVIYNVTQGKLTINPFAVTVSVVSGSDTYFLHLNRLESYPLGHL